MLEYDDHSRSVSIIRTSHVDNKSVKSHGDKLRNTAREMYLYLNEKPNVCIRQRALSGGPNIKTCLILAKVVGISDFLAKAYADKDFQEVFPNTIKRVLTGDCNATKQVVANSLEYYVGKHDYAVDDESDAVAVGLAWLIGSNLIDANPQTKPKKLKVD